jgi:succinyl-diaminopimelate desuccinylase
VTSIEGGEGFSVVPNVCTISIDVRLTPSFDASTAHALVEGVVRSAAADPPGLAPTEIEWLPDTWPAYRIDEQAPIVSALRDAASAAFGRRIPARVAGPSNIGNYLSTRGVPAIAGFGVTARGIHGTDESIELATIGPVWTAYRHALATLLAW